MALAFRYLTAAFFWERQFAFRLIEQDIQLDHAVMPNGRRESLGVRIPFCGVSKGARLPAASMLLRRISFGAPPLSVPVTVIVVSRISLSSTPSGLPFSSSVRYSPQRFTQLFSFRISGVAALIILPYRYGSWRDKRRGGPAFL